MKNVKIALSAASISFLSSQVLAGDIYGPYPVKLKGYQGEKQKVATKNLWQMYSAPFVELANRAQKKLVICLNQINSARHKGKFNLKVMPKDKIHG